MFFFPPFPEKEKNKQTNKKTPDRRLRPINLTGPLDPKPESCAEQRGEGTRGERPQSVTFPEL